MEFDGDLDSKNIVSYLFYFYCLTLTIETLISAKNLIQVANTQTKSRSYYLRGYVMVFL